MKRKKKIKKNHILESRFPRPLKRAYTGFLDNDFIVASIYFHLSQLISCEALCPHLFQIHSTGEQSFYHLLLFNQEENKDAQVL